MTVLKLGRLSGQGRRWRRMGIEKFDFEDVGMVAKREALMVEER